MKAYWSYGKILKPLMTELYYTHSDGNAQKILLAYIHDSEKTFRRISNITGTEKLQYQTPTQAEDKVCLNKSLIILEITG